MSLPRAVRSVLRRWREDGGPEREAPRAVRSAVLDYGRRTFVKSYRREVALEFRRGQALHEAARATGAFRAPRPIALVEEQDLIVWECLDGLQDLRSFLTSPLRQAPGGQAERALLFGRIGRALAAVHAALRTVVADAAPRYDPFAQSTTGDAVLDRHVAGSLAAAPRGPLHWDFVCGNLFLVDADGKGPELVVIDASPNWYLFPPQGLASASPVHVDAATLAFSLTAHPRFSPAVRAEAGPLLEAFRKGYLEGSGVALDRACLLACAAEVTRVYQEFARAHDGAAVDGREDRFRSEARRRLLAEARAALDTHGGEETRGRA